MAQTGYTAIQLYHSSTPGQQPLAANLADGEVAINIADRKLYAKNAGGTVVPIGGGGAGGGGTDQVFYENDQLVTVNYTITTNRNALTAGPITINNGITVTVPTGSTWSIV